MSTQLDFDGVLKELNWKTAGWKVNIFNGIKLNDTGWMDSITVIRRKNTGEFTASYYYDHKLYSETGSALSVEWFINDYPHLELVREFYGTPFANDLINLLNDQIRTKSSNTTAKAAATKAANEAIFIAKMDRCLEALKDCNIGEDMTALRFISENNVPEHITPMKIALRASAWCKHNELELKQATFSQYPTYYYPESVLGAALSTFLD